MRYFEIYVPGKNGYSAYFKTDKPLPFQDETDGIYEMLENDDEELIVQMAVSAQQLDASDAEIVKYVCELSKQEAAERNVLGTAVTI